MLWTCKMGYFAKLFLCASVLLPCVYGQEAADCFSAGSVAGAAIGAFFAALILVAAAYYARKFYLKSRKGKHLIFSKDPESVKDEFAFDNPGFRGEEARGWQHEAPTLPMGGKSHALQPQFTRTEGLTTAVSKDDLHLQRGRVRRVKLWARDFTGLGLRCSGGVRDGVRVHSVLRSGPAAAAHLKPGDKIKSIKVEFTGTPLEDAVGIISLASPYPVELEVEEGGRISGGEGRATRHPLLRRAGSTGDINTLEREAKLLHPPKSPNTSQHNSSTLEAKGKGGIKKIITEKIITTTTLERNKKEKKDGYTSTLERENEKNSKLAHNTSLQDAQNVNRPEKSKARHSTGNDVQIIQPENGVPHIEHAEVQKREYDPKRGMKFGIRVLPPNVPDDGVLKYNKNVENGVVAIDKKSHDEPDKPKQRPDMTKIKHENETEQKKPIVAKRREKMAPPIPNARVKSIETEVKGSRENTKVSDKPANSSFDRTDLNSSGIKRDENGIPQELPQHMLDAAKAARSNRKSSTDLVYEKEKHHDNRRDSDIPKSSKKAKGKAPSPPEHEKNKSDDSILEQLNNVNDFLKNEKQHSSLLHDSSILSNDNTINSYNTSTPKVNKMKSVPHIEESINFSQDDIDEIVSKPFRRESDSLNNFYEDSKSNMSSNPELHSVVSFNNSDKSDKGSTKIELNNSDITIHSSPLNETAHSTSDEASMLDDNERKAASLGDLSRFDLRLKTAKPSTGTLERAQSLDISADDADMNQSAISPKKRKANSVVETTFFDSSNNDVLPDMLEIDKGVKNKEPRLSLNMTKSSAMDGLNTFQRNRLKKGSEFGNLEDAIVKSSSSSLDSDKGTDVLPSDKNKLGDDNKHTGNEHETSDHLARRIMDENLKVNYKLVSEFAKSTSDGSNMSSLDSSQDRASPTKSDNLKKKDDEKLRTTYDTNICDDMKVSRSTYVNSLERPKSDMMKKLLAKNPILNVHVDQSAQLKPETSRAAEIATPMTDASKSAIHQPDIVNFDLKPSDPNKDYDDYVSNIRVGSNNNSLKQNKKPLYDSFMEWTEQAPRDALSGSNVVTITTTEKTRASPNDENKMKRTYTKSIEIGEPSVRPDVIEVIKRRVEEPDKDVSQGSRTVYMEPPSMAITMTQEPIQKTVTVNVAEDEFGNKVITQNVEKVSTQYITTKMEAPLQVEQISFGIMKNAGDVTELNLDQDEKGVDKKILEEIMKQNPNMHITSEEPTYTKTETIILNTQLDEEQAVELMEKIKSDPNFMAQKTPEELSQLGIRIIHDLEDIKNESHDTVEVTKTRYSISPGAITSEMEKCAPIEDGNKTELKKNHVTEIQVITPKAEKQMKQKDIDKIASRQRAPAHIDPPLTYELDISLLDDFISNERHHSAKQYDEIRKENKKQSNDSNIEPKKRHSDFDLPRNSQIQFRTATYESPKGTIVTSTDIENRRQSQLDQIRTSFDLTDSPKSPTKPAVSAKPSNIPVKMSEKSKPTVSTSKIPVFMSQKSLSQENLMDKTISLPRSPPPRLSGSSGNISVTSIKSSSKNPSGKL